MMIATSTAAMFFFEGRSTYPQKKSVSRYMGGIVANLLPYPAFTLIFFGNFFRWALGNWRSVYTELIQYIYAEIFFWRGTGTLGWFWNGGNLCTCNKSTAYLWYDGRTSIHVSQNHN